MVNLLFKRFLPPWSNSKVNHASSPDDTSHPDDSPNISSIRVVGSNESCLLPSLPLSVPNRSDSMDRRSSSQALSISPISRKLTYASRMKRSMYQSPNPLPYRYHVQAPNYPQGGLFLMSRQVEKLLKAHCCYRSGVRFCFLPHPAHTGWEARGDNQENASSLSQDQLNVPDNGSLSDETLLDYDEEEVMTAGTFLFEGLEEKKVVDAVKIVQDWIQSLSPSVG